MAVVVRRAEPAELLDLRWRELREGRPRHTAHMTADDHPDTRHWAAVEGGEVVGCVSVMRGAEPRGRARWQLRAMAIDRKLQGRGLGAILVKACSAEVAEPMWCNARIHAIGFYERQGWNVCSGSFEVPQVGLHKRMRCQPIVERYRGRHLELVDVAGWEFVRRHNASGVVAIAALTPEGALLLVEQLRVPVNRRVIELPAGLAGDIADAADEPMVAAARRELEEETGYRARTWVLATEGPASAGLTDEWVHLFVASDLQRVGPGGGDASEDIVTHEVPRAELVTWLTDQQRERGCGVDHKVWSALAHLDRLIPS